ncbi:MAG: hypothetical protein LBU83_05105 [Bacteroidales bacterium]|jgi:hypothetical protein|nr:hypothetical protein [Bacteroidales bacterium]
MNTNKQILVVIIVIVSIVATIIFSGCKKKATVRETEVKVLPAVLMLYEPTGAGYSTIFQNDGTIYNWTSSNPNIATLKQWDRNVDISPHTIGETIITGKTEDGRFYTSPTTVIVKPNVIDGDYATEILFFYYVSNIIDKDTVDKDKLITIKYLTKNKIIFSIDEKFQLSQTEVECPIKVDCVADVIKIKDTVYTITRENFKGTSFHQIRQDTIREQTYKAVGESFVIIDGTPYPVNIEGVFTIDNSSSSWKVDIDMIIKVSNVSMEEIKLKGYGYKLKESSYSYQVW